MDLVEVNPGMKNTLVSFEIQFIFVEFFSKNPKDAGETEKEQTQTVEMGRRMISCASGELLLWVIGNFFKKKPKIIVLTLFLVRVINHITDNKLLFLHLQNNNNNQKKKLDRCRCVGFIIFFCWDQLV